MLRQLKLANEEIRLNLDFHKKILNRELPYTAMNAGTDFFTGHCPEIYRKDIWNRQNIVQNGSKSKFSRSIPARTSTNTQYLDFSHLPHALLQ